MSDFDSVTDETFEYSHSPSTIPGEIRTLREDMS